MTLEASTMSTVLSIGSALLLALPFGALSGAAAGADAAIEELDWMAGCWEQRSGERVTQEQWMAPLGGTMIGMSRVVSNGQTVAHELLRIEENGDKLTLIAWPSGQEEARFEQLGLSGSSVQFENPRHDFPQRIGYRLLPDGSLLGRIEGIQDGEPRAVDFPLRRARCPGPNP